VFSPLETTSDELTRRLFQTNTLGTIAMARSIVPHTRQRGSGTIVNVTSSVVFNPAPLVSVYAATKTAVEGFSEALYHELAPFGIRVKLVEPGYEPDTRFRANMMAFNDANSFPEPYQPQLNAQMSNLPEFTTALGDVANAVFWAANDTGATPIPSRGRFNGQHEDDGSEREFRIFKRLEGGVCTMCARGDLRKSSDSGFEPSKLGKSEPEMVSTFGSNLMRLEVISDWDLI
jgi:NAD(P)-dependent dehydrogenase (short-subunit alcohol dehydrogenase family)